jgi:hypothetical protein
MGKLLRILVILLLLLSIGALTLGAMLFLKREILKGRTQKLENTLVALGATLERDAATVPVKPEYPARDISPVTSEILDTPELSAFWDKYRHELELTDLPTMDLNKRRLELMTYFKVDMISGRVERDPATGYKVTRGDGTMQAVLDDVLGKAEEQLNRLNTTRQQLKDLRIELVATINELNELKRGHRLSLQKIEELEARIRDLESQIEKLNNRIARLEDEKRALEDQISELQRNIALLEETIVGKDAEIAQLNDEITRLKGIIDEDRPKPPPGGEGVPHAVDVRVEPGEKGTVIGVNMRYNFVALRLSDAFLNEVLPEDAGAVPAVELMVKRQIPGREDKFIAKIRLTQIKRSEKLGVADVLPDWLPDPNDPPRKGDVIFY